jgi:ABC-2 type transport system ATP-binding protein
MAAAGVTEAAAGIFMAHAITLKNLTKTFGDTTAVRDVSLVVPEGALYGLIGPNGAGKTTLIRMILSILFPDKGELTVLGHASAMEAKDRIGYLPEERGVYKKMRVGDFIVYMARLKGMDPPDLMSQVRQWLVRLDLAGTEGKRCEELSKGMQQKVQFITSVIHRPDLLILDEPFSGLDPVNQRLMRDLILSEHQRGATILFSTHIMAHAEQLCDHIVMIHLGDKVLDRTLSDIRQSFNPRHILFEPLDPSADMNVLRPLPGIRKIETNGPAWEISLEDKTTPSTLIPSLVQAVMPAQIQVRRPSLEDVFITIVSGDADASDENAQLRSALREGEYGREAGR